MAACDDCLRGRSFFDRYRRKGIEFALQMFSDAIREANRKALELAPGLAQVHGSRRVALSLFGRHEEAGREFERVIRLEPTLHEAHSFYARLLHAGQYREGGSAPRAGRRLAARGLWKNVSS